MRNHPDWCEYGLLGLTGDEARALFVAARLSRRGSSKALDMHHQSALRSMNSEFANQVAKQLFYPEEGADYLVGEAARTIKEMTRQ